MDEYVEPSYTYKLDFENRPEDFAMITDRIDAQLFGLF